MLYSALVGRYGAPHNLGCLPHRRAAVHQHQRTGDLRGKLTDDSNDVAGQGVADGGEE
jgi:hypothetical protein